MKTNLTAKKLRGVLAATLALLACSSVAFCGEIHDAAKAGDVGKVKTLLKANPNLINEQDNNGKTPLHHAVCAWNGKPVVEVLLAARADLNVKDKDGWTPLQLAGLAKSGYVEVAPLLISHGAQVDALSAARLGGLEIVKSALEKDPNLAASNPMLLQFAAYGGQQNVVELLLANKADVNSRHSSGRTPLHFAVQSGRVALVELLLKNNAVIDAKDDDGQTALHFAADFNKPDIAKLLLDRGADAKAKDKAGKTPLRYVWTTEEGKIIADLLRKQGAKESSEENNP